MGKRSVRTDDLGTPTWWEGPSYGNSKLSRRQVLQRAAAGTALLAVPGLLAACGSDSSSTGSAAGGSTAATGSLEDIPQFTLAIEAPVETFDIAKEFSTGLFGHLGNVYEAPLRYAPDGSLEAGIASSWDEPDPKTIVLKIRDGVTFHDGKALTAKDVLFSLERNLDPKAPTAAGAIYYGNVVSVEESAAKEVTIKLKQPDALFLIALGGPVAWIHQQAYVAKSGKKFGTAGAPGMGTGPMKIVSFNAESGYKLERYESYWSNPSKVKKWETRVISDPQALLLAVQSGEVNGAWDVPLANLAPWESASQVQLREQQIWYGFAFGASNEPWSDVHLRRAVAYACDLEKVAPAVTSGTATPNVGQLVAPLFLEQLVSQDQVETMLSELPSYPFDLEKAEAELKKSSVPNGLKVDAPVLASFPTQSQAVQAMKPDFEQIGIEMNVKAEPESTLFVEKYFGIPGEHKGNELLPMLWTTLNATPDPADTLASHFSAASIGEGGLNGAAWDNPQVQKLIGEQLATSNPEKRFKIISEILRIQMEELPYYVWFFGGQPMAAAGEYQWSPENAKQPWFLLRSWMVDGIETI